MHLIAYIAKEWEAFVAALENLVGWHKATGTVPLIPAPPGSVSPAPDHGATPPENAGATGVSVGKSPVGMSAPDSDGCVQIPAIAAKLPPGTRFMTVAALPFVAVGSAQAFAISANCLNARMTLHLHGGNFVGGPENFYCLPPVANPASAVAIGGAAFHLLGQVYGEPVGKNLPNAYAITSDLTTVDEIVAFYGKFPDYAPPNYAGSPVAGGGAGFGPKH